MWPADSESIPDDWAGYLEQSPENLRRVCGQLTVIVPDDWAGYLEQSPDYLRRVCGQLTVVVPSILQPNFSEPQSVVVGSQEIQQISREKNFFSTYFYNKDDDIHISMTF